MDWFKLDKVTIFTGKDENGNRYLSQFLRDYKEVFGKEEINAGCPKCLESYYTKFIKHLSKMEEKTTSLYRLKPKYNGISLGFGSNVILSNRNITDELAERFLKEHPRGKDLFDKMPEAVKRDLTTLKRRELDVIARGLGIDPSDYSNKAEVIVAIEDVEKAK